MLFHISSDSNLATPLTKMTFSELNFTERKHLQEWIDKDPSILGEDLLIIQKEFDGFSDTNERLDLLALDKSGRLVLIENKLDDSGKDVVWQSLKYVSYCASLSKSDIKDIYQNYLKRYKNGGDSDALIAEFYNCDDFSETEINTSDSDQRIILVAANLRKEVTSTVLWLQNHNLDIKCIRVTPYKRGDDIFLDTEQILPPPSTEKYQIKLGLKKQEEHKAREEKADLQQLRYAFWTEALPQLSTKTGLYQNVSPTKEQWVTGSCGLSGIGFNPVILKNGARAELSISKPSKEDNKTIFHALFQDKDKFDAEYGTPLKWEELEQKASCRISISLKDVSLANEDDWPKIIEFLSTNIALLLRVFKNPLNEAIEILNV